MAIIKNKNKDRPILFKTILFLFLLLPYVATQAQDDEAVKDTVQIETAKETHPHSETDDDKKVKYFQGKSQYAEMIDSMQLREIPGTVIKQMQEDDDYWYANADLKKKKINKEDDTSYVPIVRRSWFQTLLWLIIIGGFAGFIIWWLAGNKVGLFRKKIKSIDDLQQDEMDTEDIFSINYQKEIDKATQHGNYRLAVRLMFLRLLKNLSEKNIIQYKQGKTNFDYLLQLQPTRYYKDFFRITRNYEYSWYGQFEVGEQTYYMILDDFKNFDRLLR